MRKILLIIGLVLLVGCYSGNRSYSSDRSNSEDSISEDSVDTDTSGSISLYYDVYKRLDSLTAQGEYILQRGADRNYDTIIDHVHYIFTTEE